MISFFKRGAPGPSAMRTLAAVAALAMAGGVPAAAETTLFNNPAKQFQIMGKVGTPAERTVYLPVTQVRWMLHSSGKAKGGVGPGTLLVQEVDSSIDAGRITAIAKALHDDLVAQLEAAGWNVQTRDELGTDVPSYRPLSADGELGAALVEDRGGDKYVLIAPPTMPAVANTGMALSGVSMATNSYMRRKPGVNLFVTYSYATAAIRETASRRLEMETKPVLTLTGVFAVNTSGTTAIVTSDGVVVANDIGTLTKTHETGLAVNVLRYATRQQLVQKTEFSLDPDWDKVEAEAVRAGRELNAQIVARLNQGR